MSRVVSDEQLRTAAALLRAVPSKIWGVSVTINNLNAARSQKTRPTVVLRHLHMLENGLRLAQLRCQRPWRSWRVSATESMSGKQRQERRDLDQTDSLGNTDYGILWSIPV